jgi:hypothetical protein
MRFVSLAFGVLLAASAFMVGRITASPPAAASGVTPTITVAHFECYTATFGKTPQALVQLTDQFQQYQTNIGPPELFCTPVVKKVISGHHQRVPTPADHLTCYAIQGPAIQQSRPYVNQFVTDNVTVGTPSLLCLPTNKMG